MNEAEVVIDRLSSYGSIIANSLYFLIVGMLVIFLLYKFANRYLYARIKAKRLVMVIFGTLYVLVFVIMGLLLLDRIGHDVSAIGELAVLVVLIGAVVAFFLVPFLPRFPFRIGQMIEINGVIGTVDAITTFHTQIRSFDGSIVFIPTALLMASRIVNYHLTPNRRVELNLSVGIDSDLSRSKELFLEIMNADTRVLSDPAPVVYAVDGNAVSIELTGFCWVVNNDWFAARSDLWFDVLDKFQADPTVNLAMDKQEMLLSGEVSSR